MGVVWDGYVWEDPALHKPEIAFILSNGGYACAGRICDRGLCMCGAAKGHQVP